MKRAQHEEELYSGLERGATTKGVITKGVFSLEESPESLRSLSSLESLENDRILRCLPVWGSLKSLESINTLESLENGLFEKTPFPKDPLFRTRIQPDVHNQYKILKIDTFAVGGTATFWANDFVDVWVSLSFTTSLIKDSLSYVQALLGRESRSLPSSNLLHSCLGASEKTTTTNFLTVTLAML